MSSPPSYGRRSNHPYVASTSNRARSRRARHSSGERQASSIAVSPLSRSETYLDLERGPARPVLTLALLLLLPGMCATIGGLVAWRRRR